MINKISYAIALILAVSFQAADALFADQYQQAYTQINLSYPAKSQPLEIPIRQEQSASYGWRPGQKITLRVYVQHTNGQRETLRDIEGRAAWTVSLDSRGEAKVKIVPHFDSFSGRLEITANRNTLYRLTPGMPEGEGMILEKVYEYRFPDGAGLRIHFTDQLLEESGADPFFGKEVLDAATLAYQTITQFQGFAAPGYAFARPDASYAQDPDRVIDIYLGNPSDNNPYTTHGFANQTFKDAPCFDTIKEGPSAYQAMIFLPANYRDFIQSWERINPSSMGRRNIGVDLKGTLMHEMLHVVLFYYNKNLNKDAGTSEAAVSPKKKIDWYVEGLARYFETFGGARHDFFSQGFKETLPDKIRFSRGGSNFFMRYPDQAFTDLRYENAIFWRFLDYRFGMGVIEKLSRQMRGYDQNDFQDALEHASGLSFKELLKRFAMAALLKDFGLKDDSAYLKDIARTRLVYRSANGLSLVDGFGDEKALGARCLTDWIGRWDLAQARLGQLPAGGDNTPKSDVSAWATDFIEIKIADGSESLPWIGVTHRSGGAALALQIMLISKGGSRLERDIDEIPVGATRGLSVADLAAQNSLSPGDVDTVYLLVTNTDRKALSDYEIIAAAAV